jgi:2-(1,2-epoxy-1,2-dihydrophenyl)acetyl-CoA isomerase
MIEIIRNMVKPVVGAINGPAAGAGLFLVLACGIRLMAHDAYLKVSNTSYGLSLRAGGTYFLPRFVGMSKAQEMVMLDKPVSAKAAYSLGLVTKVVESKAVRAQAAALADELSHKATHTLGLVKQLINTTYALSLVEQLAAEQQAIVESANHAEGREGIQAFLQNRNPDYVHTFTQQ